jgi:hypothetical protein
MLVHGILRAYLICEPDYQECYLYNQGVIAIKRTLPLDARYHGSSASKVSGRVQNNVRPSDIR